MAGARGKRIGTGNTDRMHFRLAPGIKARVVRAASIAGQGLTDFAISALSERADEILERHDTVSLDARAHSFFLQKLDHAHKPSPASRTAATRYRSGRRRGVRYRFAD
jgi:uncharacterized protein (DUF1778 family)